MALLRLALYLLPFGAVLAAWWSSGRASDSRTRRGGDLIAMLPGKLPALNPFSPAGAMEQQLVDLVYEPLLRVADDGTLVPALASHWQWSQQLTCWFATPAAATKAADHLHALSADRWIRLGLTEVSPSGVELALKFSSPTGSGPDEILGELAAFEPLPVDFLRVRLKGQARAYHEHFLANALEKAQVRRSWFDAADQTAEHVVCGAPGSVIEEMRHYYAAQPELAAEILVLDRIQALREPVLEFRLAQDRHWPDQTPVSSRDVAATAAHVLKHGIPMREREGLEAVHLMETPAPDRLRVIYRRHYGAALCAWMRLPVLPANWLDLHGSSADPGHPPGTGPFRPSVLRDNTLLLDAADSAAARIGRIRLQTGATPLATEVAAASGGIDLFWPQVERLSVLRSNDSLLLLPEPPTSRLLVMWNLRRPMLQDTRVRRALALGTDRAALIRDLLGGAGGLHDGIFPPGLWFGEPLEPLGFDPEEAARLLDEAGWHQDAASGRRKRPGKQFKLELLTMAGNAQRENLARLLAEQWTKLGIEVQVVALPWTGLVGEKLMSHQFDAAILGQDFSLSWDQRAYWHSIQAQPGGLNFSGLIDTELDLLLESLAAEFDPSAIAERARRIEERIRARHPFLPLFTDQPIMAVRRASLPVEMPPLGGVSLRDWVLETTAAEAGEPAVPMRVPDSLNPLEPPR